MTRPSSCLLVPVVALGVVLVACGDDSAGDGAPPEAASTGTLDGDESEGEVPGSTGEEPDPAGAAPDREPPQPDPDQWVWDLPPGFPVPYVPEDNPMSAAKVELGRHVFYDERLSIDGTMSCATCHRQELAFTDGRAHGVGATGEEHVRGAMTLANVAYASTLSWADPALVALEEHALVPLFGDDPIEMGLVDEADLIARISDDPTYLDLFEQAFPDQAQPMTLHNVTASLACFQRTLISGRSPFDRWFYEGDEAAVSDAVKRGYELFHHPFGCFYCHFGFDFTDAVFFADLPERSTPFHNVGLYNLDEQGAYPEHDMGLYAITGKAEDMGRFKAPTLRNIAVTGPYMHDGSIETLAEVLEHYADGGRTIPKGPYAGVGADNPHKDVLMGSFDLGPHELSDGMALLESLTDQEFLTNPAFSDPWEQ